MGQHDETRSDADSTRTAAPHAAGRPASHAMPSEIGRYRVVRRLGAGGMGEVFEALDLRLGRHVALKRVLSDRAHDPEARTRLEREARAVAALEHPGIVTLLSIEDVGDSVVLAFELVRGRTLADVVAMGPLPLARVLDLGLQLCDAVAAAHSVGIVHRDLKPLNVMITADERVKVLDFGLARLAPSLRALDDAESTVEGGMVGTPAYMSPEQVEGRKADERSDTWALGCTLHEMTSGRRPFHAAHLAGLLHAIREGEPEPLPPEVPPALSALVARCLRKDRESRPSTAGELRDALRSIARGVPPALAPVRAVPAERDEFVGRDTELERWTRLVESGARHVTITGPGGVGKTRFAARAARTIAEAASIPTWLVDLSEARDAAGIAAAVARCLDVPLGKEDAIRQLGHALASRGRCLIVLDNFEQVADAAPATLGAWLDACPSAIFVATSRAVLGLAGEHVFALPPLRAQDGFRLFASRSRAAGCAVDLDRNEVEREAAERLVELLDHLPLAIELAAARTRLMAPSRLLERLGDRFTLLSAPGRRDGRQATLRATLDWSWELLSPAERSALAQASVFAGGFTLDAAEAVLVTSDSSSILDVVQALVDRSLVRPRDDGRFDMLVTVHEYARERLARQPELGGCSETERRHGGHFAQWGRPDAVEALSRHGGLRRRRALTCELDNVVAACGRAVARGDAPVALACLRGAEAVLELRGPLSSLHSLAESVLSLQGLDEAQRADAQRSLGLALWRMGRLPAAEAALREAHAAFVRVGDLGSAVATVNSLAALHAVAGGPAEAIGLLKEALETSPSPRLRAISRTNLGSVLFNQGSLAEAVEHLELAAAEHRDIGDARGEALALMNLGLARKAVGDLPGALACLERARDGHRECGDRRGEAMAALNISNCYHSPDRIAERREQLEAVLRTARELGDVRIEGAALANLATVHELEGRDDLAVARLAETLPLLSTTGSRQQEGEVLVALGAKLGRLGRVEEAEARIRQGLDCLGAAGLRLPLAEGLAQLARVQVASGRRDAACETVARAQSLLTDAGVDPHSPESSLIRAVSGEIDGERP